MVCTRVMYHTIEYVMSVENCPLCFQCQMTTSPWWPRPQRTWKLFSRVKMSWRAGMQTGWCWRLTMRSVMQLVVATGLYPSAHEIRLFCPICPLVTCRTAFTESVTVETALAQHRLNVCADPIACRPVWRRMNLECLLLYLRRYSKF